MSDLEILNPDREITISGQAIILKPFAFGQLGKAAKLLKPVAETVAGANIFRATAEGGELKFFLAGDWLFRMVDLLAEGGDDLIGFLAFATGQPREFVENLLPDDGIALTKAVFEVNSDFFVRRVLPLLGLSPTGEKSSSSSSSTDTDVTTSTDTLSGKSSSTSEPLSATESVS